MGIAHALDHSYLAALPPVLLLVADDLRVSLGEISVAATFAYLLFGAGALIGGPLSDKVGESKVILLSLGLAGASTLVLYVDRGYVGLVAMLVLSALWSSFYHPTANSLISKRYREEMGKVMGFHGVCGSVGQVFVPMVAVLLALAAGWRSSFIFFGVLSVAVSLYFSRIPSTKRERRAGGAKYAMFKGHTFWVLLAYNIMMGLYFRGTELFLPAYLTKVRGLSIEASAFAVSLLLAFGVLGQFLGGVAGDRIGSAKALLIESIVVSAGFAFLQFEGLIAAIAFLILFGVAFYATQPTTNALAADVSSPEQRGVVYGIMFFTTFGLGSISSMVAGRAAEVSGLQLAFSIMLSFSLTALVFAVLLRRIWETHQIKVLPAGS